MAAPKIPKAQIRWLNRINLAYAVVGLLLLAQLSTAAATKSFFIGWAIAVLNLEILKKLGTMLITVFEGRTLHPIFYVVLIGKFAFLGLIIALFTSSASTWIQGIPFALGMSTLLIAGASLGLREMLHAR